MSGRLEASRYSVDLSLIRDSIRDATVALGYGASLAYYLELNQVVVIEKGEEGVVNFSGMLAEAMSILLSLEGYANQLLMTSLFNDPRKGDYGKPPTGPAEPPDKSA